MDVNKNVILTLCAGWEWDSAPKLPEAYYYAEITSYMGPTLCNTVPNSIRTVESFDYFREKNTWSIVIMYNVYKIFI